MQNQRRYQDERIRIQEGINQTLGDMVSQKRKRNEANGGDHTGAKRPTMANPNGNGHGEYTNGSSGESFANTSDSDFAHQLQQASSNDASSTAAAALAAQLGGQENAMSFVSNGSVNDLDRHLDASFDLSGGEGSQSQHHHVAYNLAPFTSVGTAPSQVPRADTSNGGVNNKPRVGSDEWNKIRRDNHKEVERRRRETINEGINEIAKIVPNCEKNKGSILQSAVSYILHLKSVQDEMIEQRTLEKVVLDEAISSLSASNEDYKKEIKRAWAENARLKKRLRDEGITVEEGDGGEEDGEGVAVE